MPVTVVPMSAATSAIDTFITDVSSVIRNCAAASTKSTKPALVAADGGVAGTSVSVTGALLSRPNHDQQSPNECPEASPTRGDVRWGAIPQTPECTTRGEQPCRWHLETKETLAMVVASSFGTGEVFLSMLWFFLFIIWFWLIIAIFSDIFRSHDLSGGGKALWSIFVIVLPFIGIFSYLIARGHKMSEHAIEAQQAQQDYFKQQVQGVVGESNPADQLAQLATLKEQGVITDEEFTKMKAKVVA